MNFNLSEKEKENFERFKKKAFEIKPEFSYCGPEGGRFSFEFTSVPLGMVVFVKDNLTGEEEDITDFGTW